MKLFKYIFVLSLLFCCSQKELKNSFTINYIEISSNCSNEKTEFYLSLIKTRDDLFFSNFTKGTLLYSDHVEKIIQVDTIKNKSVPSIAFYKGAFDECIDVIDYEFLKELTKQIKLISLENTLGKNIEFNLDTLSVIHVRMDSIFLLTRVENNIYKEVKVNDTMNNISCGSSGPKLGF